MLILIIDYGETSISVISEILADLNVDSIIQPPQEDYPSHLKISGVILSGGPDHVYQPGSRKLPSWIFNVNIPILGICYGMQLLVKSFGGKISKMTSLEKGFRLIKIVRLDPLFRNLRSDLVWMNHLDTISKMPIGFKCNALTSSGIIAGITNNDKIWGIQFHPENKTEVLDGYYYFENFIEICTSFPRYQSRIVE